MKVNELKDLLDNASIEYSKKSNKNALIDVFLLNQSSISSPLITHIENEILLSKKYPLYEVFMRTIHHRTFSLFNRKKQSKLKNTERKLLVVHKADQKFIDIALTKNPDSLTPLFPFDMSVWNIKINS